MTPRIKKWPFQGDAPVARARKVALAYRATATAHEEALKTIGEALQHIDWPAAEKVLKAIGAIASADTQTVEQLDQRFTAWGETWHCPRPVHYDDDDYVDSNTAGELIQLAGATIQRYRVEGRIKGIWNEQIGPHGGWVFRVGDLYQFSANRRPRGHNLKGRGGKPGDR
jgi:hypothetical protein